MNDEQVRNLLKKYRLGTISNEDRAILESWYLAQVSQKPANLSDEELRRNLQLIEQKLVIHTKPNKVRAMSLWYAAAVVLIMASATIWYMVTEKLTTSDSPTIASVHDVMPGGNKAILTLADGRSILLSSNQHGVVVADSAITYADGSLVSESVLQKKGSLKRGTAALMSISTPKGGTYQIALPDGTKVWLNAASTLNYPSTFDDNERLVELTGEAYFEVAKWPQVKQGSTNQYVPFTVRSKGQEITVLGTAFNVSAYADEPTTRTVLVNGSVKIAAHQNKNEVLLNPGEEAVLSPNGITTREANVTAAIAWKSGKFRFEETELHEVMKQLGRWYDLEVTYHEGLSNKYFFGVINRDQTLSGVLNILKESGVNFSVERTGGINKVTVLP